jgi:hypothetical protein
MDTFGDMGSAHWALEVFLINREFALGYSTILPFNDVAKPLVQAPNNEFFRSFKLLIFEFLVQHFPLFPLV